MYFISILTIIILSYFISFASSFKYFIDAPSFVLMLIIYIPVLVSANLIKDFNNAFRIALGRKKDFCLREVKRALEAVSLSINTLLCSGMFIFLFSMITILHTLDTPETLGPHISIALISAIYACGFALIQLPLKSILNIRIIEYMPETKLHTSENQETENTAPEQSEQKRMDE